MGDGGQPRGGLQGGEQEAASALVDEGAVEAAGRTGRKADLGYAPNPAPASHTPSGSNRSPRAVGPACPLGPQDETALQEQSPLPRWL